MAKAGSNADNASNASSSDSGGREHCSNVTHQKQDADESKGAAGNSASEDTAGEAEEPAIGVVLLADELKTPLDMNGTPFEDGQLVECQKCWKRMHAPQSSPYLRCFNCNSVVRPETPAEKTIRRRPMAKVSGSVHPGRASTNTPSARANAKAAPENGTTKSPPPRTRQPLSKETFARFESTFLEVKAAEVMLQLLCLEPGVKT